ncbi:MAG: hypothetical protein JNK16_01110 [Phycisphaerales bacterium]|nr:hypothetical protein [Phycisphaerales bacterium]
MTIRNPLSEFSALAAALSLLAPLSVHAAPNNMARATVQPDFFGGTGPFDLIVQQPGTCDASGSATGGGNSSGNASTHTQYGFINLHSHAEVSLNATATGLIRDNLTFTAPGYANGTAVTVTYSIRVDGSMSAPQGSSASTWSVAVDLGGGVTDLRKTGRVNSPRIPPAGYQGDPYGTYSATATVQLGFPALLYLEFAATADAANHPNEPGLATVHFAHLDWNGIIDVKVNGNSIPGVTVSSESGTNWGLAFTPCAGDLNGDAQVDDADFILFVSAYNLLDCADPGMPAGCPADLNGDGFVDDSDFVVFVTAYNQLICP